MSKVVAIEHLTLDGVMQGPGRPDEDRREGFAHGGWAAAGSDPAMQKVAAEHMGGAWSLLVGRVTYEDFAGHWPRQPRPNRFSDALDNAEKFVASTTLAEPRPWRSSRLLKGDAAEAVARLKQEHDRTLVIFGSGVLVRSLMRHGLIDELVLQVHPLVLGTGRRLFPDGSPLIRFRLASSATTATGVVIATYRPAAEGA
jgi:dihydrofolate reductase